MSESFPSCFSKKKKKTGIIWTPIMSAHESEPREMDWFRKRISRRYYGQAMLHCSFYFFKIILISLNFTDSFSLSSSESFKRESGCQRIAFKWIMVQIKRDLNFSCAVFKLPQTVWAMNVLTTIGCDTSDWYMLCSLLIVFVLYVEVTYFKWLLIRASAECLLVNVRCSILQQRALLAMTSAGFFEASDTGK